jgi:hypothetical protein
MGEAVDGFSAAIERLGYAIEGTDGKAKKGDGVGSFMHMLSSAGAQALDNITFAMNHFADFVDWLNTDFTKAVHGAFYSFAGVIGTVMEAWGSFMSEVTGGRFGEGMVEQGQWWQDYAEKAGTALDTIVEERQVDIDTRDAQAALDALVQTNHGRKIVLKAIADAPAYVPGQGMVNLGGSGGGPRSSGSPALGSPVSSGAIAPMPQVAGPYVPPKDRGRRSIPAENGYLARQPTEVLIGETPKARRGGGEVVSPLGAIGDVVRAVVRSEGLGGGPLIGSVQVGEWDVFTESQLKRAVADVLEARAAGRGW